MPIGQDWTESEYELRNENAPFTMWNNNNGAEMPIDVPNKRAQLWDHFKVLPPNLKIGRSKYHPCKD